MREEEVQREGDTFFEWRCPACRRVSKYASRFWKADRVKCQRAGCFEAEHEWAVLDPEGMILVWDEQPAGADAGGGG